MILVWSNPSTIRDRAYALLQRVAFSCGALANTFDRLFYCLNVGATRPAEAAAVSPDEMMQRVHQAWPTARAQAGLVE